MARTFALVRTILHEFRKATKQSRMLPNHTNAPKRQFRVQWGGSGALVAKNSDTTSWHELLHYFGPFCTERTQSTPLEPKLLFRCVSYHLVSFGTVWLPYKTRCKMGRSSAKVHATKSGQNFAQSMHLIHPIEH